MNKAFIAICFWQSLPDLPPLGRHVPLTAFYRLVKAESSVFLVGTRQTFRCLQYLCRKQEPGNDDIIHRFNVKIIIQIRPHVTFHGYLLYNFLFPNQATQAMRRPETSRYSR